MSGQRFTHEALFYQDQDGFLAGTVPFVRDGVESGEAVLVALAEPKIDLLREQLDGDAAAVRFVDMPELGRNPARIISVWRQFVADRGRESLPIRGIGEPVWPGRSDAELIECDHHESLLNLAFAEASDFTLLCPYDAAGLDDETLEAARRNHPTVIESGGPRQSGSYVAPERAASPFTGALARPAPDADEIAFDANRLTLVRRFVEARAEAAGLDATQQADLTLAVNELATNSVRHGGGTGTVRAWREGGAAVCEVADYGQMGDPLVGREPPAPNQLSGRGLWIVNQLCDLVQIRSGAEGTVVRVRIGVS